VLDAGGCVSKITASPLAVIFLSSIFLSTTVAQQYSGQVLFKTMEEVRQKN
jgi:hypothetical protein